MVPENRIQRFLLNLRRVNAPAGYPTRRRESVPRNGDGIVPSADRDHSAGFILPLRSAMSPPPFDRLPSPEEIHFHAALFERLANLRRSRRGLWSRIWGFIQGN
jgi:hypothetical protein